MAGFVLGKLVFGNKCLGGLVENTWKCASTCVFDTPCGCPCLRLCFQDVREAIDKAFEDGLLDAESFTAGGFRV